MITRPLLYSVISDLLMFLVIGLSIAWLQWWQMNIIVLAVALCNWYSFKQGASLYDDIDISDLR